MIAPLPREAASMRRREFTGFVGWTIVGWPLVVHAQQGQSKKRVGVLIARPENDPEGESYIAAFQQALGQLGWRAGQNIEIVYRWTAGDAHLAESAARELVAAKPDILVINATPNVIAARHVAGIIPIVMVAVADPVAQGFVQSLERPGGSITGFAVEEPEMGAKWVELLKEIAPKVRRITAIYNPDSAPFAGMFLPAMKNVQAPLSFELAVSQVLGEDDLERVITIAGGQQEGGLVFLPDSFSTSHREMIANLVAKQGLPAIYSTSTFVRSGGLIGYGFDRTDIFRRSAGYVDLILKGEKPSQLPVQMPTKYELAINLRTAKALGLLVSPVLLARADEVIE
jgi:putative ABC transport system substrate-binding protein